MNFWLKITCILLLFYVVVFSFWHPLAPGLIGVDTPTVATGQNQFVVMGYNTHFKSEIASLTVLLEADSNHRICCEIVSAESENQVTVSAVIPDTLSNSVMAIYANNKLDGTVYFPNAISVKGAVLDKLCGEMQCATNVTNEQHMGFGYPFQPTIFESIRNLMFHVPMWFTMFFLMILSFAYSLRFLVGSKLKFDEKANATASTGLLFCILGLITGSVWARFTWGAWWVRDPQLNGALVVFIIYVAYIVLRRSIPDEEKRARLSAIYNIFAFVMLVVLLMILPRYYESLHPGKDGNPAFSSYDLDSSLRTIFYPAVIGWILLGYWIYNLNLRIKQLEEKTLTV